jgi:predicted nucleic acid-binding protein
MTPYVDSGILIKLYVRERNSAEAISVLGQYKSLNLNQLQELEIRNSFRALEGRTLISSFQRASSEHELEVDLVKGRLQRSHPDWGQVFLEAVNLSRLHSVDTLARSLDLLHVAVAMLSGADLFLTGDKRQYAVALQAGMQAEMIE